MSFDVSEFKAEGDDWEEINKKEQQKKIVKRQEWETDSSEKSGSGFNIALPAYEWKGKSLFATLFGYLNHDFFDKLDIKEKFPECYDMFHTGLLPEVELIQVLDLDASYKHLSHTGIFGKLVKTLYDKKRIQRKTIKIPKRQQKIVNRDIREISTLDIDKTKMQIENEITIATRDNGSEIMLLIDSMSSYDELLNDKFRILYENVIADSDKRNLGSSLKGIKQSFWTIRNGWWLETLRDKRTYEGFQIDTYKISKKSDIWLEKEISTAEKTGKDINKIVDYIIQWAPRTEFELDLIMYIDNDKESYWVDVQNRLQGNVPVEDRDKIYYTPNKVYAVFEVFEKLAPYIKGDVDEKSMWS